MLSKAADYGEEVLKKESETGRRGEEREWRVKASPRTAVVYWLNGHEWKRVGEGVTRSSTQLPPRQPPTYLPQPGATP